MKLRGGHDNGLHHVCHEPAVEGFAADGRSLDALLWRGRLCRVGYSPRPRRRVLLLQLQARLGSLASSSACHSFVLKAFYGFLGPEGIIILNTASC